MRPLPECLSPFGIRLTHNILQERFRFEDLIEIPDQDDFRLLEIREQDLARSHMPEHDLRQDASGVIEVLFEIVGDCGPGLLDRRDRGCALQDVPSTHPTDCFAQRKRASESNLTVDIGRIV
jgi:hypothetical protein